MEGNGGCVLTNKALSSRPTGVFVAAGNSDPNNGTAIPSIIPNRISYALNLQGPSEYYEAACTSTLVALHRAVQSIRHNECEQAVVRQYSAIAEGLYRF